MCEHIAHTNTHSGVSLSHKWEHLLTYVAIHVCDVFTHARSHMVLINAYVKTHSRVSLSHI